MKLSLWVALALISLIVLSISLVEIFAGKSHPAVIASDSITVAPVDTVPFVHPHERFIPGDTSSVFWMSISYDDSLPPDISIMWHSKKGWNKAMEALHEEGIDTCSLVWR